MKLFLLALVVLPLTFSEAGIYKSSHEIVLRDYWAPVSEVEKEDLSYIINLMGMGSLTKIIKSQSSLKRAGKRIDHLHPFNFLLTIFLDDEMTVSIHAMKSRSWVWDEFLSGVKGSLETEAKNGNLLAYVDDFANQLQVSAELLLPSIEKQDWTELVKVLLKALPCPKSDERYDI